MKPDQLRVEERSSDPAVTGTSAEVVRILFERDAFQPVAVDGPEHAVRVLSSLGEVALLAEARE